MRNFGNSLAAEQPVFSKLDLRVGVIVKVWEHPTASKLWCEEIDVGGACRAQNISTLSLAQQPVRVTCLRLAAG